MSRARVRVDYDAPRPRQLPRPRPPPRPPPRPRPPRSPLPPRPRQPPRPRLRGHPPCVRHVPRPPPRAPLSPVPSSAPPSPPPASPSSPSSSPPFPPPPPPPPPPPASPPPSSSSSPPPVALASRARRLEGANDRYEHPFIMRSRSHSSATRSRMIYARSCGRIGAAPPRAHTHTHAPASTGLRTRTRARSATNDRETRNTHRVHNVWHDRARSERLHRNRGRALVEGQRAVVEPLIVHLEEALQ